MNGGDLLALNVASVEGLNIINDNKVFAKIPNDFFYNDGRVLNNIGGRDSFLIYCLLTSRKNMNDEVYISIKEMVNLFQFEKNISRSKARITKFFLLLKENGYVNFDINIENININEIIKIEWISLFPKLGGKGWIKFYADDFLLHSKIGNIPYVVMWILRMYVNHQTKTSFIAINDMAAILKCDINKVQNAVNLFRTSNLFEVIGGDYYYHPEVGRKIKMNNQYKYTNEIDNLLNMDDTWIYSFLHPSRKLK